MIRKIALAALLTVLAGTASANPPSDILLKTQGPNVQIQVLHKTKDVLKHFIVEVKVWLNNTQVISQKFGQQADNDKQSAVYLIPSLKAGDQLKVSARCNIYGEMSKKFVVNKE